METTMMDKYNTTWVRRLYFNIIKGRFKWEKYQTAQEYYGVNIQTFPLFSDFQQRNICGFTITFPYQYHADINYCWDNDIFQVGEQLIEFDLITKQLVRFD